MGWKKRRNAVRALHHPQRLKLYTGEIMTVCQECYGVVRDVMGEDPSPDDHRFLAWPCRTACALDGMTHFRAEPTNLVTDDPTEDPSEEVPREMVQGNSNRMTITTEIVGSNRMTITTEIVGPREGSTEWNELIDQLFRA